MKKYQIGVVGYGDFTKVMLEYLEPYADIIVSSRKHKKGEIGFGARFGALKEILAQPVIIPSIPSQTFEEFFANNKSLINPKALVVDVCSVKVKPLKVLEQLLPKTCQIIGTHPLFGPGSITKHGGIEGLPCAFSPVRAEIQTTNELRSFLADTLHLNVLDRTPEEHDREMAHVMGLSHYVGRVMQMMGIPESELATVAYKDLLDMKRVQGEDSWDLFTAIMKENPFAYEINQRFKQTIDQLDKQLELDES